MTEINPKARANPRIDESTHATKTFPADELKNKTAKKAVRLGSNSVNRVLSAKLVLDIEKTAIDLSGITANRPTTTANAGKTKSGTARVRSEVRIKTTTHVIMVKREKAKHLLK